MLVYVLVMGICFACCSHVVVRSDEGSPSVQSTPSLEVIKGSDYKPKDKEAESSDEEECVSATCMHDALT